jgi:hypothetical protein
MIQGAASNVLDFGADPTGVASSLAAFNAAMLIGGTIYVPSGTYKLDGKVTFSVDGTTLFLAANTTLNVSGVAALQSPFGAQLLISANRCAIIGSGPSSLLQNVLGTYANTVTVIPGYSKFLIRDLTMDGGKSLVTTDVQDTFGSGIMFIGYTPNTPVDIEGIVDNVTIRNYAHYGVSIYGNQANGIKITNCTIREIGIASQPTSVGCAIVAAPSGSDLNISNNTIKNCKRHGIFISSASVPSDNHVISGNNIHQNGESGIAYLEEANFGSVNNVGIVKIAITGNVSWGNGRSGIVFNVDTVGKLNQISITGNNCCDNILGGIEINCTNTSPNIITDVNVSGNQASGNGTVQIAVGQYVGFVQGVERSFLPVISGSTSAGVGTYASRNGTYTIIDNIVYFQMSCEWTAHTGTGDILISGFPFAAQNSEPQPIGWVWSNGLTITGQATFGLIGNTTSGPLGAVNNGSYSAVALDTNASLRISGFYFAVT